MQKMKGAIPLIELTEQDIIAYTEAWRVIQLMPPEEKSLIPIEAMDFLDKNKDLSKGVKINPFLPLEKQGISKSALCVLGGIMLEITQKTRATINEV